MSKIRINRERSEKIRIAEKRKQNIKISYVILGVFVPVLIGVLVYFLWLRNEPQPENERRPMSGRGVLLTTENINEVRDQMDGMGPDSQYTVSMTTGWIFENAQTPSHTASVDNLATNSRTVFIEVTLRETGELVYISPYIPLGETLEGIALDEDISAGEHEAIVTFYLVDDDFEIITDVSVSVTLIINE